MAKPVRLFPAEKADCEPDAEYGQAKHHADRQQDVPRVDSQKGFLHQGNALRQREEADDFLHCARHDLDGECRAGKDQHREIEDGGDHARLFDIPCHTADQHTDGECGKHGEQPAPEEPQKRTMQPHTP